MIDFAKSTKLAAVAVIAAAAAGFMTPQTALPAGDGQEHAGQGNPASPSVQAQRLDSSQSVVKDGVRIEFNIVPLDTGGAAQAMGLPADRPLQAGDDAEVTLTFTDAGSGAPLSGINPAAWIDARKTGQEDYTCRDKIEGFLQGQLSYRPEIDLNAWYIVALNDRPSLTVIDPLLGFGGQKTVALVLLDGVGEDWALTDDHRKIFVTIPDRQRVSVVDTSTWKVADAIDLPVKPINALLQPDERYLWVGYPAPPAEPDDPGGVVAIDTLKNQVAGRISTGAGPHDIAVSGDDRTLAVASAGSGIVTLIDIGSLKVTHRIPTGGRPVAVAWSSLAEAFYVADEATGEVLAIDPAADAPLRARIETAPGLAHIDLSPDGRWAFAANRAESRVEIIDVSVNRVAQSVPVGAEPYRIAFTEEFAYVRSAGVQEIGIIPLLPLSSGEKVTVKDIAAGRSKPGDAGRVETAMPIVETPDGNGVLISNPLDRSVYFYMEGMAAASGSFPNEKSSPRGVLAVSQALRDSGSGAYRTATRIPAAGQYDVAVLLDTPRTWHCFTATALVAPGATANPAGSVKIEYLVHENILPVGQEAKVRFRLRDAETGAARTDVKHLKVLTMRAPGTWQRRSEPVAGEDGVWEVTFTPPRSGLYYVFVKSAGLNLNYRDLPFLSLRAHDVGSAGTSDGPGVTVQ